LDIEHPVLCRDSAAFHFHATLPRMLGPTLIRDEVVQVCQPREKRQIPPDFVVNLYHIDIVDTIF
jgi:hypothetical protein